MPVDWSGAPVPPDEAQWAAALYDLDNDAPLSAGGPGTDDVEWFRALAQRLGGPVLEIGCGTGRIAVPLALDGHRVVGIDRSAAMLSRARRRSGAAVGVEYREGDAVALALGEKFQLIVIAFNTFLEFEPEGRAACLASVRAHLLPRGRVALDVFQPDPTGTGAAEGLLVEDWTRRDPLTGHEVTKFTSSRTSAERTLVSVRYDEVGDDRSVRRMQRRVTLHHLYRREAELLFAQAGLPIESVHGDFDGSPAGEHSARLLIVAGFPRPNGNSGRAGPAPAQARPRRSAPAGRAAGSGPGV
ncbi:MAG: class I SAM-dependent methyltransferase [Candidatus Limnocylindria bacterium]